MNIFSKSLIAALFGVSVAGGSYSSYAFDYQPIMSYERMDLKTLFEYIDEHPNLNIMSQAITHAGLEHAFTEGGPFTLFAISDSAFAQLPTNTVDALFSDDGAQQLNYILGHHTIEGILVSDLVFDEGIELETSAQTKLFVGRVEDVFTVEGYSVIADNIETKNGIIHIIDAILLPPR